MATPHESHVTRRAHDATDLITRPVGGVPQVAIEEAGELLRSAKGLTRLMQPKKTREISIQLQVEHLKASVDAGIEWLRHEADTRIVQIELSAEQRRTAVLSAQNEHMGQLKQQQCALAGQAMRSEIAAERRRQIELRDCDCLDEDKRVLSQLYQHRALQRIQRIAREHGVAVSTPKHSDEAVDADADAE